MPISGTLDVALLLDAAPLMPDFAAEPWQTEGVETLQVLYEIDDRAMADLLPPALHPTIPPTLMITVARFPDGPCGPFTLAEARVGCRAGTRPRGFLLRAYCDTAEAAGRLASGWGFNCRVADVRLQRFHDRIVGTVRDGSAEILHAALVDPEPVSGGDIQYVASMHLARVASEGGAGMLVQVDPEYRFHRAERGRAELSVFAREAWDASLVEPVYPVVASYTVSETGMPHIRYVVDPNVPAMAGTRAL